MDEDFSLVRKHQLILTQAYERACQELGISAGSLDVWRRERVAEIVAACAKFGTDDLEALKQRAVAQFIREQSKVI